MLKQNIVYVSDLQLAVRYSVSRSTIWRWTERGILPTPVRLSSGCTRWKFADIEAHDAARKAA
ncbi:MAG: AlpA family phage regulatory protein [Proteobacteria bacterium]|nr:AlpA family phage regulatory protein [Pseudomonadota bacterium]